MQNIDYTLYLVTNRQNKTEQEFLNTIEEAIKGGVTIIQLREKNTNTKKFYNIAKKVKKITTKYNIPLIINDRIDIAQAINAEGIHLGQNDMPCNIARKILGKEKIIGISATTIKEAQKAQKDTANYIGCGAIFPTKTKNDAKTVTIPELTKITKSINIPVIAIGGITKENKKQLKNTKIKGISVVSAITESKNPQKAAKELKK